MKMKLRDVLDKLRRADKVTVFDGDVGHNRLFTGCACQLSVKKRSLMDRKVKEFHPELLDGLYIYLEGEEG